MHRKLQSKNDALKIMRTELEKYRIERDQFKLMAETLQLRYSAIKNSLNTFDQNNFNNDKISNVGVILSETRGKNMTLQTEVEALRQKVSDLQGDIACLRQKNVELAKVETKQGGGHSCKQIDKTEGQSERSNMIAQMEAIKKKVGVCCWSIEANLKT
jgi:predicted transcriptional regulator